VDADGYGQYKDDRYGINLQVDANGTGMYKNSQNNVSIAVDEEEVIYKAGDVVIEIKSDGSGSYENSATGLIIVCVIPIIISGLFNISRLSFTGTSLIIIVGVVLETIKAIESQMLVRNYRGFLLD